MKERTQDLESCRAFLAKAQQKVSDLLEEWHEVEEE